MCFFPHYVIGEGIQKPNRIGELNVADETVDLKKMITYLQASATEPGFFPPVNEGNASFVDGAVMASVDIPGAVEKCREIVENDEDIVLDVIMVQEGSCGFLKG